MKLTNFDADAFLRDYWQMRPLLIRNPWDAWQNPLEPDELAGLACEDGIESRLVERAGEAWNTEQGAFPERRFGALREANWTLLVQAVDQFMPAVAALIEPFRFVPDWRIDDVMVSVAATGGGVGPHFDQYDVFLVQGLGQRRWRLGAKGDADSPLLLHGDLRLLADFETLEEHVLGPGDILYVPPGFAHDGIAESDDCMTYSIGFRAPSRSELVAHFADHVLESLEDDDRYADPDLIRPANPGEIAPAAIARLHAMITESLLDGDAFARWLGAYVTAPKYPDLDWTPEQSLPQDALHDQLAAGASLHRSAASRFSFIRQDSGVLLFVDGQTYPCAGAVAQFAETLCAQTSTMVAANDLQSPDVMDLLATLYARGSVSLD
ncbi:MAG: cupin domain-containing protein [Croceibacterium sp.]